MVYRIFVEKREGLANEAKAILSEIRNLLGMKGVTNIRLFNRYDVENIAEDLFADAVNSVFSEPQLDIVTKELPTEGDAVFAVEYLPGQFDQRADSAAQCIQIISCGERPTIRTARVYVLEGKFTADELAEIKKATKPTEILLTIDAMTGQESVNVAKEFNEKLEITGVIVTKLDGDTRGGVALSVKAVTGKPIKFCGVGEKIGDIEPFYPDRMASRILGMGDVLTLIDKAQASVDEAEMKKVEENLRKNTFTLEDFLIQFEQIGKMGNIADLVSMIPGAGSKFKVGDVDEQKIKKYKAIIQSMTKKERLNPDLIKASNRKRIAEGSASTIQEVNALMKQFEQTKQMMKGMNNGKLQKMFGKNFKF